MLKYPKVFLLLLLSLTIIFPNHKQAESNQNINESTCTDALLEFLSPVINHAIEEIYPDKRSWARWETKILNIEKRLNGGYYANIKIKTYVGAHNPPYGTDILTIEVINGNSKLIKYKHKDD